MNSKFIKVRFDEICKNISDRVDDPKKSGTDYYVGLEHLDSEDLKIHRNGTPDDVNATKLRFKKGQILFGKRRFYQRKLAVAERSGICSAHMLVLEAIPDKIEVDFLPILMQSEEFFQRALMISEGSLSPTIKWKNLAKQEFLIPPINEQEKIIVLLDNLEILFIKTKDTLDKYKILKNSMIEELFSKGIGHSKFKKIKSLFGKYNNIPENWKIQTLDSLTTLLTNGFVGKATEHYTNSKNGILYVQGYNVEKNDFNFHGIKRVSQQFNEQHPKSCLKLGDLLTIQSGDIGTTAIVSSELVGANCHALIISRFKKEIADPYFYCHYFNSNHCQKIFKMIEIGTTIKHLNGGDMKKLQLPCPPLPEQQQIASILSKIDSDIDNLQNHFSILKILKKSILSEKLKPKKLEVMSLVQ